MQVIFRLEPTSLILALYPGLRLDLQVLQIKLLFSLLTLTPCRLEILIKSLAAELANSFSGCSYT